MGARSDPIVSRPFRGRESRNEALITAALLAVLMASARGQRQFDEFRKGALPELWS